MKVPITLCTAVIIILLGLTLTIASSNYHRKVASVPSLGCFDCQEIHLLRKGLPLYFLEDNHITGGLAGGDEHVRRTIYINAIADVFAWATVISLPYFAIKKLT